MLRIFAEVVRYIFSNIVLKGVTVFLLMTVMALLIPMLFKVLDLCCDINSNFLNQAFNIIPPEIWYFLDWFNFSYLVSIMISALTVRFLLTLIPVVGPK